MNCEKLEQAGSYTQSGFRENFINYEPTRRGAQQLSVASSSQVKAKARDLSDDHPGAFKKYR